MREIKFRAWHKINEHMHDVLSLQFTMKGQIFSMLLDNGKTPDVSNIELMEYTGLKDCKGKKIYEGDIIKCYDGITKSYFNSVIEWQIRELTHEVATVPLEVSGFIIGSLSEVEIIGNIYENPELQEATA